MRKRTHLILALGAAALIGCGGGGGGDDGGDDDDGPLFPPKPECQGDAIEPLAGVQPQVINKLEIGGAADGFDLDGDGSPDNKLAAVASLAKSPIEDSLASYSIVIPFEFFDLPAAAADTCVKFAIYLGDYVTDTDADGRDAFVAGGDCNDHEAAIFPGAAEVADNLKDDDCDGLADEDDQNTPSANDVDGDGDGMSPAAGDCDDTDPAIHPGAAEVCGDGFDNDCDGVADRTEREGMEPACSPFDTANPATIALDPLSFDGDAPAISFHDGVISEQGGTLVLDAGPSLFRVNIPIMEGVNLELRITGATIKADVVQDGDAIVLRNGHLGGVIDAKTADTVRGLDVPEIGLDPTNSLLDATFANLLGPLLALPRASDEVQAKYDGCRTPDIDVDRDGLESFCDSNPDDDVKVVDRCIDGDGTEIEDVLDANGEVMIECTQAQLDGADRFVDGISVELNFETSQVGTLAR